MHQQIDLALAEVASAAEARHALTMECLQCLTSLIRLMQTQDADLNVLVNHLRAIPSANGGRLQAAAPSPVPSYPRPYVGPMPPLAGGSAPGTATGAATGAVNGHPYPGGGGLSSYDMLRTAMERAGPEPQVGYDNGDYYGAGVPPVPPRNGGS